RYCCQETVCDGRTFLLDYSYAGRSAEIKQQIVDMAMNASGIRDTARVLHVSPTTVIKELKKLGWQNQLEEVSLQFCEIRDRIPAKTPTEGTLLTTGLPCLPQCLPGTDVLGSEVLSGEGPEPCGSGSDHADGAAQH